jgi:hypothetical protein
LVSSSIRDAAASVNRMTCGRGRGLGLLTAAGAFIAADLLATSDKSARDYYASKITTKSLV